GVVVELPDRRLRPLLLDGLARRCAAPAREGDLGVVVAFRVLEAGGELLRRRDALPRLRVGRGEVDLLAARRRDGEAADDDIELAGDDRRNDADPRGGTQPAVAAQVLS